MNQLRKACEGSKADIYPQYCRYTAVSERYAQHCRNERVRLNPA